MIFAKNFARNFEKKIILGTSDAWLMSRLSHWPIDPAYYIEDWRISDLLSSTNRLVRLWRPKVRQNAWLACCYILWRLSCAVLILNQGMRWYLGTSLLSLLFGYENKRPNKDHKTNVITSRSPQKPIKIALCN